MTSEDRSHILSNPAEPAEPPSVPAAPPGGGAHAVQPRSASGDRVLHVVESVQTVLTALVLAFVFRAFFVEAFIIPTGSMAPSLLGGHGTLVCPVCGLEFDYGPGVAAAREGTAFTLPADALCPNCHTRTPLPAERVVRKAGDRILVHKWPYDLGGPLGPKRWDVIVFRDPADAGTNYIKRLVGLPGDTVEIVDGDVYVNGRIARKPPAAQEVLWSLVFDQKHVAPGAVPGQPGAPWVSEPAAGGGAWRGLTERVIRFDPADGDPQELVFFSEADGLYLRDVYAYNGGSTDACVGDVRMCAEVVPRGGSGWLEWEIVHDDTGFRARIESGGRCRLTMRTTGSGEAVLGEREVPAARPGRPLVVEFGHLDYRVYLKLDRREVLATREDQYAPNLAELRRLRRYRPPQLRIRAAGWALALHGLRVERDVHYTYREGDTRRAQSGEPFELGPGAYFVLGDNSPRSHDSREWYRCGPHLQHDWEAGRYQLGTVRADQIVGRAFFVYLPGLLPLDGPRGWRVPDLGRARAVR